MSLDSHAEATRARRERIERLRERVARLEEDAALAEVLAAARRGGLLRRGARAARRALAGR